MSPKSSPGVERLRVQAAQALVVDEPVGQLAGAAGAVGLEPTQPASRSASARRPHALREHRVVEHQRARRCSDSHHGRSGAEAREAHQPHGRPAAVSRRRRASGRSWRFQ